MRSLYRRLRSVLDRTPRDYVEVAPDNDIPVDKLVSPLRYDVIVRRDHFSFLREHRDLYDKDFFEYARIAKNQPYFVWFRDIACRRFAPELLRDQAALDNAFAIRLRSNVALHDSYRRIGFDRNRPITLRAGRRTMPTDTGKMLQRPAFTGGGCHRIGLLLLDGYRELPAAWVRIRLFPSYQPLDNTFFLISGLRLPASAYYAFLSLGYANGSAFQTREALRQHVRAQGVAALEELDQVLAIDERELRACGVDIPT